MRKIILVLMIVILTTSISKANNNQPLTRQDLIQFKNELIHYIDKRFTDLREDTNKRFELMNKRLEDLREDMNKRFEQINKRFEDINKRFEDINKRFEDINKRFEQLYTFLWMITGIFTTIMVATLGFAYWDRRTIIRKAKEETIEHLEERGSIKKLIEVLREKAKTDPELAKILKQFNLL